MVAATKTPTGPLSAKKRRAMGVVEPGMGKKQPANALGALGATQQDVENRAPCAASASDKSKRAIEPAAGRKRGVDRKQAGGPDNKRRCRGPRGAYAGHVEDFNVPPDHECIPMVIAVGAWVYTCFKEYNGHAHRGIITNRVKRTTRFLVRFLDDDTTKKPSDYELEQSVLFKTRDEAERHHQQTGVNDLVNEGGDGSDCGVPQSSTRSSVPSSSSSSSSTPSTSSSPSSSSQQASVYDFVEQSDGSDCGVPPSSTRRAFWQEMERQCDDDDRKEHGGSYSYVLTVTDMPESVICCVLAMLQVPAVMAVMRTCTQLLRVGSSDKVWGVIDGVTRDLSSTS